jgi:hypothetical protein
VKSYQAVRPVRHTGRQNPDFRTVFFFFELFSSTFLKALWASKRNVTEGL